MFLREFKTNFSNVPQVRILPIGGVGTGKPSFINSIESMLKGTISKRVRARPSEASVTTKVRHLI